MKISLKSKFLFLCLFLFGMGTAPLLAESDWSFLPAGTVFKPLIGEPREPIMGLIAHLEQQRYEGQIGISIELVRYSPADDDQIAWGLFALGNILLDQDGATFPMLDGDFYIGTYFSGSFGIFSARLEALHESTHLGDSFEGTSQVPLYYNQTVTYTRENVNGTVSLQPLDEFRLYAGAGIWDLSLYEGVSNPMFASFGTELYSPSWSIDRSSMRLYATGSLQWVGDESVWDKEIQLGVQWKGSKDSSRDIRFAVIYYNGNSQFGQFYNVPDEHWALATFFDF